MKRIVWLASYPKSGSTWLRMLFAAYHQMPGSALHLDEVFRTTLALMPEALLHAWNRPRVIRVLSEMPQSSHAGSAIDERIRQGLARYEAVMPGQIQDIFLGPDTTSEMLRSQLLDRADLF